jgi:Lar family restriction alleviation protein
MTTDRAVSDDAVEAAPLPCPFCGGPAVVRRLMQEYPADGEHPAGEYEAWVTIACDTCGIEIGGEYRSEAIAAWNRRSAYPIIAGEGVRNDKRAAIANIVIDAVKHVRQRPAGLRGPYVFNDEELDRLIALAAPPPQPGELERHQATWSVWKKLADHGYLSKAAADQGPQGYQASVIDIIKSAAPPPQPEVAGLVEELGERLQAIIDWADMATAHPEEFNSHGVRNLEGPVFDDARAALASMDGGPK